MFAARRSPLAAIALALFLVMSATMSALMSGSVKAATDTYNLIIDLREFKPEGQCTCSALSTAPVNACYFETNSDDNNVGYRGVDGSAPDGWQVTLVAKFQGTPGTIFRTSYIFSDGTTNPDSHGDLNVLSFQPLDNPDFHCSDDWFDRYHVRWTIEDVITQDGNSYALQEMKYLISDIDDSYELDPPGTTTCFTRSFCKCLYCGPLDIFTASPPITATAYVFVQDQ